MSKLAVGLMSGTSLDGIDAALVSIDEDKKMTLIDFETLPIDHEMKAKLKDAMDIGASSNELLCSLNFELGYLFSQAVKLVCEKSHTKLSQLDFIASHGQTIFHIPDGKFKSTMQLGEPAVIAYETGVPVVSNFRSMDMAAGGQGAPLVPYFDYVNYLSDETICLLNIGGISNVTIIPKNASIDDLVAFDTGPGNMIINGLMEAFYDLPYDKDGQIAALGQVNLELLEELLSDEYIHRSPPKSTGREKYGGFFVEDLIKKSKLPKEDLIATLTKFTALAIVCNIKAFGVSKIIANGGGVYNKTLMKYISESFDGQVEIGEYPDAKEAMAFALLGYETLHKRTSNVPSATGARKHVIQGSITYPS
ncbi:anhydro-N-acetylmuramic acid kinase AnmK [Acidaminobacter sp. JC074]|uniref:anhydro-N-acetylmuramic acid kinase AnmK n=1 Tax=Acidaminobacter sp. JC074 TaxID=2530199 RepID=UPI00210211E4|nr:anhydro-N-acetylmuramic acid kinase AnmK [Acidaminobacter sp. JC074]